MLNSNTFSVEFSVFKILPVQRFSVLTRRIFPTFEFLPAFFFSGVYRVLKSMRIV